MLGGCGPNERNDEAAVGSSAAPRPAASDAERAKVRRFWAHASAATRLRVEGKPEEAIAEFRLALEIDPKHEDCLYGMGNALLDLGREEEARDAYRRLVEANAFSARGNLQLGALANDPSSPLFGPAEALAAFEAAHRINAEETGALAGMAEALLLLGDDAGARRRVDEILVAHPQSRPALFLRGFLRHVAGDRRGAAEDLAGAVGERLIVKARRDDIPSEGDTEKGSAALGATSEMRVRGLVSTTLEQLLKEQQAGTNPDADRTWRVFGERLAAGRARVRRPPGS